MLMATGPWNEDLLNELSVLMRVASFCGLGQAAPNPVASVLKHFRNDLMQPLGSW
jgi:formate dehydrogenase